MPPRVLRWPPVDPWSPAPNHVCVHILTGETLQNSAHSCMRARQAHCADQLQLKSSMETTTALQQNGSQKTTPPRRQSPAKEHPHGTALQHREPHKGCRPSGAGACRKAVRPLPASSVGLRLLLPCFSATAKQRHRRRGHLWQAWRPLFVAADRPMACGRQAAAFRLIICNTYHPQQQHPLPHSCHALPPPTPLKNLIKPRPPQSTPPKLSPNACAPRHAPGAAGRHAAVQAAGTQQASVSRTRSTAGPGQALCRSRACLVSRSRVRTVSRRQPTSIAPRPLRHRRRLRCLPAARALHASLLPQQPTQFRRCSAVCHSCGPL